MKTFIEETPEQQLKIIEAMKNNRCEVFLGGEWEEKYNGFISFNGYYREAQVMPDSVDWSQIGKEYKYIRRIDDICSVIVICKHKPSLQENGGLRRWEFGSQSFYAWVTDDLIPSYKNNGAPWDEMILDRPEDE